MRNKLMAFTISAALLLGTAAATAPASAKAHKQKPCLQSFHLDKKTGLCIHGGGKGKKK